MQNKVFKISNRILYKRYKIICQIRNFFLKKNILEVETPMLTKYTTTDLYISPFQIYNNTDNNMWLITSPEFHMKRLLSQGIGPIYQLCHSFRKNEYGTFHNPEFTMLEWYQPFYNMFDMMELIEEFFFTILNIVSFDRISYQDVFIKYLSLDPENTNIHIMNNILKKKHKHLINSKNSMTEILDLLFMLEIQPNLGQDRPIFIYHYPASQALLARINDKNSSVADRFEIFFKGLELGNGFFELIDYVEQFERFKKDNIYRKKKKLPIRRIDFRFLNALQSKNMPYCSGIAIGIDRLIMLILNMKDIRDVLSFPFQDC